MSPRKGEPMSRLPSSTPVTRNGLAAAAGSGTEAVITSSHIQHGRSDRSCVSVYHNAKGCYEEFSLQSKTPALLNREMLPNARKRSHRRIL